MSYRLKIDPKSRKAAKFISQLQKKIQTELIASGMTQQQVADVLGVDRSVVNRRLKGGANLTARTIAEFAYVFDKEVSIDFVSPGQPDRANGQIVTSNVVNLQEYSPSSSTVSVAPLSQPKIEGAVS